MGNYLCPCLKEYNGCCGDISVNRSGIRINIIEATTTVPIRTPTESLSIESNGEAILRMQAFEKMKAKIPTSEMLRKQLKDFSKKNEQGLLVTPEQGSTPGRSKGATSPDPTGSNRTTATAVVNYSQQSQQSASQLQPQNSSSSSSSSTNQTSSSSQGQQFKQPQSQSQHQSAPCHQPPPPPAPSLGLGVTSGSGKFFYQKPVVPQLSIKQPVV